ncbi:aminopeptidase P N-terminal domain-containing protein [Thalassotalea sp. ND16A]|uniref:aminopeptidase P N-terminal domain-containing protein n=1 Tax=Thalassotalea sp. ND16A TaxID=1535422 RepID=UPI00051A1B92|nr:aminopeptidase P N-terminal domain-containing protein [Thalassotalea sp. ND16A]KGJ98689.1 hypothetical protein ND16A_0016 [Thalassotalea sp. ND16A]
MSLYKQRRELLNQQLDRNSVVIIVGNTQKTRSKNIKYHFRADNDLFYFSGFAEPDAIAVLRPGHEHPFVLFNRGKDEAAEINFGQRAGQQGAIQQFHADLAFDVLSVEQNLPQLLEHRTKVYYLDEQGLYQHRIFDWINQQRQTTPFDKIKYHRQLLPFAPIVHNMRVLKSPEEIAKIKLAVKASTHAHRAVMRQLKPGLNEGQLEATFLREIANHGSKEVCYPSIVAGGNNACCLHYEDNNCSLADGDLLLIDAGGEYQHYCSDITRTMPINGKFSVEQTQLYQLVLNAIDEAIAQLKPGLCWSQIYTTCMQVLAQGLIDLGILTGSFDEVWQSESYKQFTIHKTGHFLGLDVHDVGSYHDNQGQWLKLQENMVFTIEPGIYIPQHCLTVEEKWRGIGLRVEDDILITKTGYENLSAAVPRTISEIESLMSSAEE